VEGGCGGFTVSGLPRNRGGFVKCVAIQKRLGIPALEYLKLHALRKRRYHLGALFLIQVYRGLKYCPSLLKAVGLRLLTRYLRDFSMFNFSPSIKNCLSARCASAANVVCRDFDVFKTKIVSLSHIL
jgi:hypothetical protein